MDFKAIVTILLGGSSRNCSVIICRYNTKMEMYVHNHC